MSVGDMALLILILGVSCYVVVRSFIKPKCRCNGCFDITCEKKTDRKNPNLR